MVQYREWCHERAEMSLPTREPQSKRAFPGLLASAPHRARSQLRRGLWRGSFGQVSKTGVWLPKADAVRTRRGAEKASRDNKVDVSTLNLPGQGPLQIQSPC